MNSKLAIRALAAAALTLTLAGCPAGETTGSGTVVVGAGLIGNGTDDSPLEVHLGGSGSATTAARSDHVHATSPERRLYSRLMTPQWLKTNADVGARLATFGPSTVYFGEEGATARYAELFNVPLLDAGALDGAESYLVRIVVNQIAPAEGVDNDPTFGLTDGTHFVGFQKLDTVNNDALGAAMYGTYGNVLTVTSTTNMGTVPSSAATFEIILRVGPGATAGTADVFVVGRAGSEGGQHLFSGIELDRTAALSFAVFANDTTETYEFGSFEISVEREAP